ncbi:MAG: transcriptional repressor [Cyanobacteria bacterium]|nr:transcriptional repressor [Cyanobacteriota bacterium]
MGSNYIEDILNSRGVKPTPQRAVIIEYLMSTKSHPTAEEVMKAVEGKLPVALSRATVYNTLNTLVEAGLIKEVTTEPGRTRYDAKIEEHHHFVDVRTGTIFDIEPDQVSQFSADLGKKFKINGYQITFYGEVEAD